MKTSARRNPERMSAWIVINFAHSPSGFLKYAGFAAGETGTIAGWALATVVVGLFVWFSARLPSVRANLLRPSFLKVLGLAVAVAAGFLEEIIFRKWLM